MKITIYFIITSLFFLNLYAADVSEETPEQTIKRNLLVYQFGINGSLVGCGFCWLVKRPTISSKRAYCDAQKEHIETIRNILNNNGLTPEKKIQFIRARLSSIEKLRTKKETAQTDGTDYDVFFPSLKKAINEALASWQQALRNEPVQRMIEENNAEIAALDKNLYDGEECVVCFSAQPCQVFSPCQHLLVCEDCNVQTCPTCRSEIVSSMRLKNLSDKCRHEGCENLPTYYCAQCEEINYCEVCQKGKKCPTCQAKLIKLYRPDAK